MRLGDYAALVASRPPCMEAGNPALVLALRTADRLDVTSALAAIDRYRQSRDNDRSRQLIAAGIEADAAFVAGRYHRAAVAAAESARLLTAAGRRAEAADASQAAAVARLLAGQPAQRRAGGRALRNPTETDAAGLTRASVTIGDRTEAMVLDTGANLSVLSASAARRVGVRMMEGAASVGSSTRQAVPVRIGIAPTLSIGGLRFSDVTFLVLDDERLAFPGGYRIDGIIGLPVFLQTGGLTVFKEGAMILGPPSFPAGAARARLHANGSALVVDAAVAGHDVSLHLDTGANRTAFIRRFRDSHPGLARGAAERVARSSGAGGSVDRRTAVLDRVSLTIGRRSLDLGQVGLDLEDPGPGNPWLGILGQDVLRRGAWYGVDLVRMRFVLSAKADVAISASEAR